MFHFQKLEVMHWDFWQRFRPPKPRSSPSSAPTVQAKPRCSTAFRTLLALKCSGKRDYKRYVRNAKEPVAWLRGVVDNERPAPGVIRFSR